MIRFLPALGMGLAIGVVAVIAYVGIWEVYLAATHYAFIDLYFSRPEMAEWKAWYSNPLNRTSPRPRSWRRWRLIMAFVSAALFRNPSCCPRALNNHETSILT